MLNLSIGMMNKKRTARLAGLIYLLVVATGIFSLAYVPKTLINWNDGEATFTNIHSNLLLFRFSIYSSVICYAAFIVLPILLYKLLRPVGETTAIFMVVLALLSVPSSFHNLQYKYEVIRLIRASASPGNLNPGDLYASVLSALQRYDAGILLSTVFWGLWLLPFGLLVYQSGFIPRLFGVLLVLGCIGYLVNFTGHTLMEDYSKLTIGQYTGLLPAIAEIGICIWLLIFGIKEKKDENYQTAL